MCTGCVCCILRKYVRECAVYGVRVRAVVGIHVQGDRACSCACICAILIIL